MPFFQDVDPKLTLTRVAPAPALIAEVAQMSGQKLEVSPLLAPEILMISVESVGVNEVLAKLAIAATARWEPTENGYRLVPDRGARNVEVAAERARRLQRITDGLKSKKEDQAKALAEAKKAMEAARPPSKVGAKAVGKDKADQDEGEAALESAFMGGGVDEFIPLLDLQTLAELEPGDRVVFASSPNGAQLHLNGDPSAIIANWIALHNKSASAMSGATNEMPDEVANLMQGPLGERMRKMSQPINTTPTKVIVVAKRGGTPMVMMGSFAGGIELEVRAYGANGSVLLEEQGSLDASMLQAIARMSGAKAPAATGKTTPIVYSADAKALVAMGGRSGFMSGDFGSGLDLPATLRERLFAPQKFEPLALVPGEGLAALAKARRMPLVACVPDAAYPSGFLGEAPKTVEDVAEGLKGAGAMRLVPDTTFLVVRAVEPESARRNRLDRAALGALMSEVAANDAPSLDGLAAFALKGPPPQRNAITQAFLNAFVPTAIFSMSGAPSWDGLRLYGVLSPGQRQGLAGGGKVAFNAIDPVGQAALASMLYGADDVLTVERGGKPAAEGDYLSMMVGKALGGGVDARDEPTEIAPRGLPSGGYLQATVDADTIIRPSSATGPVYYALGTDELAMFRMLAQGPAAEAMGDKLRLPESGRVGTRSMWHLRGYVTSNAYVMTTLSDDHTPKDGAPVMLASLPSDLQSKVDAKVDKLKKSPLGAMMSMGNKQP